ncbi:hypothetical protein HRG_014416 [Hirsutella rhossiliensis]
MTLLSLVERRNRERTQRCRERVGEASGKDGGEDGSEGGSKRREEKASKCAWLGRCRHQEAHHVPVAPPTGPVWPAIICINAPCINPAPKLKLFIPRFLLYALFAMESLLSSTFSSLQAAQAACYALVVRTKKPNAAAPDYAILRCSKGRKYVSSRKEDIAKRRKTHTQRTNCLFRLILRLDQGTGLCQHNHPDVAAMAQAKYWDKVEAAAALAWVRSARWPVSLRGGRLDRTQIHTVITLQYISPRFTNLTALTALTEPANHSSGE